ncbi:MAG: putative LPS assembly protein LptD [bacterium]
MSKVVLPLVLSHFVISSLVYAQENVPSDTTSHENKLTPPDSTKFARHNRFSKVPKDTFKVKSIQPADIGIDTSVVYSARTINSYTVDRITYLIGDAVVKYKNITIEAGKVTVKWNENTIIAEGLPDTTISTLATNEDTLKIKFTGLPVLTDGKEKMRGELMEYNFKTERGRVIRGRTEIQGGYYFGDAIKRMASNELNVANGIYTTCNKEEPHFHFKGKKMKIISDDKVIAKPVIFFIGKIPVAIIPFAVLPGKSGRQSGIIVPQFGTSPQEGRYLRNLGYYWATNEYFDARFTLDFFERTGVLFRTNLRYALRYHIPSGSVAGSITRKTFPSGQRQRRWDFNIRHNQIISPTTNLSVNASFVSNNSFYKEFSQNRSQRLSRQLISNATLTKRWAEGKNNLTLNLSETRDLETGRSSRTLPRLQISLSRSQFFPIEKSEQPGGAGRSVQEAKWYNFLYYDYKGLYLNSVRKDSTNDPEAEVQRRAEHDFTFTFSNPKKIFGWLTFNQSIKYDEDWFDRTKTFSLDSLTNDIQEAEDKGFAIRRTFNYTASASTKLYGTFYPRIGSIRALRHVMTPSLSFTYRPDFSTPFWGYFQAVSDTAGNVIKKDRFGRTPSGELNSLGFALNNLFQMKLGEGEKEKKINLFNLDFRGGYNFAADSLKMQNLSTSFRANPRKNLGISMSMNHSFYEFDQEAGRTVDRLLLSTRGILNFLRLTRLQFDARWTLSGSQKQAQKSAEGLPATVQGSQPLKIEQIDQDRLPGEGEMNDRFEAESAFSAFDIPWRASISFSYSVNKFNPTRPSRNAYIDLSNVEVQLTKKWRIGYRLRYDIKNRKVADQRISFYRDLHCWEAQFNWNPSGIGRGFYFRINIKAPNLRQIKIEQRGGTTSVFSPF